MFDFSPEQPQPSRLGGSKHLTRPHSISRLAAAVMAAANVPASQVRAEATTTVYGPPAIERSLNEITTAFTRATGQVVMLKVAPSVQLERRLEQGEQPNVVITTKRRLERLSRKGLVSPRSRQTLVSASLVLVERTDSHVPIQKIYPGFPLGDVLGVDGKIAVPDADSTVAGSRAMSALIRLGGWLAIASKIIREASSGDALNAVDSGEALLAVAYDRDAKIDPAIKILSYFPTNATTTVEYDAAAAADSQSTATAKFLTFLRGPQAIEILRQDGFGVGQRHAP